MVRDLHRRLAEVLAEPCTDDDAFTDATRDQVQRFQRARGIDVDGVCGLQTWTALAEAAHRLGDRLLYLQSPMLRGDDVADLQRRLSGLGFDAGRVDGIFGPDTAQALSGFQRNAGLPTDAIFGPESLAALNRLGRRDDRTTVAAVRERERLRASAAGSTWRIVLGEPGGMGGVADTFARAIRSELTELDVIAHPDDSHQAALANALDADLYFGIRASDQVGCSIAYFGTEGFESAGGHHLATLLELAYGPLLGLDITASGMRLPVLRETRMPAVVVRIGPAARLVELAPALASATRAALDRWLRSPVGDDVPDTVDVSA